jgi:hypothetical protein
MSFCPTVNLLCLLNRLQTTSSTEILLYNMGIDLEPAVYLNSEKPAMS